MLVNLGSASCLEEKFQKGQENVFALKKYCFYIICV